MRRKRRPGVRETWPHHLALTGEGYELPDEGPFGYVISPPPTPRPTSTPCGRASPTAGRPRRHRPLFRYRLNCEKVEADRGVPLKV